MSELTTDHYRMLLGLDEDWSVDAVTFEKTKGTQPIVFGTDNALVV